MANQTYLSKVSRRGNDLMVHLPAAIVERLVLKAGDEVDVQCARGEISLVKPAPPLSGTP